MNILHDSRNSYIITLVELQRFSNRIAIAKITFRDFLRDDYGVHISQCRFRISFYKPESKDVKETAVDTPDLFFVDSFAPVLYQCGSTPVRMHARYSYYLRNLTLHRSRERSRVRGIGYSATVIVDKILDYPIHRAGVFMKSIVTQFVFNKEKDQQTARHANGEPEDVDE